MSWCNHPNIVLIVLTALLIVLTIVLTIIADAQLKESKQTSDVLKELQKTNKLLLASLYSDFELEATYEIHPLQMDSRLSGFQYDMSMEYNGKHDAKIDSEWYVTKACTENGILTYYERTEAIANARHESDQFVASKIDPPSKSYLLQIQDIYPNYTNFHPFEMELFVKGQPITPNGEIVEFLLPIKKITRIQFFYDSEFNSWIPNATWEELDCNGKPPIGSSSIKIDTTNKDQFQ